MIAIRQPAGQNPAYRLPRSTPQGVFLVKLLSQDKFMILGNGVMVTRLPLEQKTSGSSPDSPAKNYPVAKIRNCESMLDRKNQNLLSNLSYIFHNHSHSHQSRNQKQPASHLLLMYSSTCIHSVTTDLFWPLRR